MSVFSLPLSKRLEISFRRQAYTVYKNGEDFENTIKHIWPKACSF